MASLILRNPYVLTDSKRSVGLWLPRNSHQEGGTHQSMDGSTWTWGALYLASVRYAAGSVLVRFLILTVPDLLPSCRGDGEDRSPVIRLLRPSHERSRTYDFVRCLRFREHCLGTLEGAREELPLVRELEPLIARLGAGEN